MKRLLLAFAVPLAGCGVVDVIPMTAASGTKIVGTGKPIVETRKAQAATSVEASGALKVEIVPGATPKLTVEAQKEILPHIKSEFKNGTLILTTEGSMQTDGTMRVRFTTPSINGLSAHGATTIDASGFTAKAGRIEATGASHVTAKGQADALEVTVTGASEANLKSIPVGNAKVEATGASKAWINVRGSLLATASGASEIHYSGKPKVTKQASGVSSIVTP